METSIARGVLLTTLRIHAFRVFITNSREPVSCGVTVVSNDAYAWGAINQCALIVILELWSAPPQRSQGKWMRSAHHCLRGHTKLVGDDGQWCAKSVRNGGNESFWTWCRKPLTSLPVRSNLREDEFPQARAVTPNNHIVPPYGHSRRTFIGCCVSVRAGRPGRGTALDYRRQLPPDGPVGSGAYRESPASW